MGTANTIQIPKPGLRDNSPEGHRRQGEWAKDIGGELPDLIAGALLFAEVKGEFKPEIYWLSETNADGGVYAWRQYFGDGFQFVAPKDKRFRARAVRSEFLAISH